MASWPRDIIPQAASSFIMPGALAAWSQSGKAQHRATVQIGRIWVEVYPPFLAGGAFGRKLIATINNFWRNGTQFDIDHRSYLTPNGGATGTAQVNGAGQTGASLTIDTWGGTNPRLKAGDIIAIAGVSGVRDVTADAPNVVGTSCAVAINPPIFAGQSPADNAIVTYTAVRLNAFILAAPDVPPAGPDGYIAGLSVTFREAV